MEETVYLFDTDMDTDCDDAGALALLLQEVRAGRVNLAGILVDTPDRYAAPACDALCRAYGVRLPIGTLYEADFPAGEGTRFHRYRTHRTSLTEERQYTHVLAKTVGTTDRDYPEAVTLYRRLLADAADGSAVIICVGLLTALDGLLCSGPDAVSPLSGEELLRKKVRRIVSMTNAAYPERFKNFNYDMDGGASEHFCAHCPVPIDASPDGTDVITGKTCARLPAGHPLRVAYALYMGEGRGRSSWDPIAVYYALGGTGFSATPRGNLCYDAEGSRTYWNADGTRGDREIRLAIENAEMERILEGLIVNE